MFGSVTTSFKITQLSILRERIAFLEEQVKVLMQSARAEEDKKNTISNQRTSLKPKSMELKKLLSEKQIEKDNKSQEMIALQSSIYEIDGEYASTVEKSEEVKRKHELKVSQLNDVSKTLKAVDEKINKMRMDIAKLNDIINSPEPTPRYHNTQGTCIHGHVNCPNLPIVNPGQRILLNEVEVSAHKKKVARAREEKIGLLTEMERLLQYANDVRKQQEELNLEVIRAQADYWQFERLASETKQKLEEQQILKKQAENEYDELIKVEKDLQNQLENLQSEISTLAEKLSTIDYQVADLKNQQANTEFEIQRLNSQLEQLQLEVEREKMAKLEEIARKQLALEALAAKELLAEQNTLSSISSGLSTMAGPAVGALRNASQRIKETGADVVKTVTDIYPSPVGTLTELMFNGPRGINNEFFGEAPTHTGNIVVDTINKRTMGKN